MGGPTYTGTDYPAGYSGSIFFSDYSGAFIKRLVPSPGGGYTAQDFASGWAGVALESGPDQNLTYVSFGTGGTGAGSVRRIVSTAGNASPLATIHATPTGGPAPLDVSFDASDSRDPDGDVPLSYSWNFGDGSPASAGVAPSHTYTETGNYTARLTVTDRRGKSASATTMITPGNTPPSRHAHGRLHLPWGRDVQPCGRGRGRAGRAAAPRRARLGRAGDPRGARAFRRHTRWRR